MTESLLIQSLPQFIFFINLSQETTHFCFYNTIQIAKYNAKHFAENIVILDYKSVPEKYEFNKTPEPYKTYIRLTDDSNYYVLEEDYHIEKFENERNQLIEVLGKLNAKSLDFQESINLNCDNLCDIFANGGAEGQIGKNKTKSDEMKQRTLFADKGLTEEQVLEIDVTKYPKKIRELIQNRAAGVLYDNYSVVFNDYNNMTGKLTDSFGMYMGFSCHREQTRKITYEYKIVFYEYKEEPTLSKEDNKLVVCKSIYYPFSLCIKNDQIIEKYSK
jgi:hypothetical protein